MSDTPTPPAPDNTPPQPPVPHAPPNPGAPRPAMGRRPNPRGGGDRPRNDGTPAPRVEFQNFAASKPNKRQLDADIEAELAAAMGEMDVSGALAAVESQGRPTGGAVAFQQPGGRKKGKVVSIHGKDVFVDIPGGRSQGVLPIMQFEGKPPQIGDEVEFAIERFDAANGLLLLTREGAAQHVSDWSSVALHMIVEAKVTGVNKNRTGLMVEVNGLKGFMPISQVDLYRVENPDQFVNQTMKAEVVEVNKGEKNLILSRRSLLEREREAKLIEFWAGIAEGQTRTGTVRGLQPFGAFVDLGGADGLIPVSEMSWRRVNHPSEVLAIGQKVEVLVKKLDPEAKRISLSLRQLLANPFDAYAANNKPGTRVTGKISRIAEFGAFVELANGVEGLIHVSELSTERVRRVRDVVTEEQPVEVQILSVDSDQRRIALSLKTIMAGEEAIAAAKDEAERLADVAAADERMGSRPVNPNLRGGIGASKLTFGGG